MPRTSATPFRGFSRLCKVAITTTLILQIGKLRFRAMRQSARGHEGDGWQSQTLSKETTADLLCALPRDGPHAQAPSDDLVRINQESPGGAPPHFQCCCWLGQICYVRIHILIGKNLLLGGRRSAAARAHCWAPVNGAITGCCRDETFKNLICLQLSRNAWNP